MDQRLTLVQQVQDAFASSSGLMWMLIDSDRRLATRPSGATRLAEEVTAQASDIHTWIQTISDVSVLDIYPGLKAVIAPVDVQDGNRYYLFAGVMTDRESRGLLLQYLDSDGRGDWKAEIAGLPDRSIDEKRSLVENVRAGAKVMEALLEGSRQESGSRTLIEGIRKISAFTPHDRSFRELLDEFLSTAPGLEFAGFAARLQGECVISFMSGDPAYQYLAGTRFSLGEGFIGQVMATGVAGSWDHTRNDPRTVLFRRVGLMPQAMICCPVVSEGKIMGVLFGGSCRSQTLEPLTAEIGMIAANMMRSYLAQQSLQNAHQQPLQRLNAVMEICRLVARAQDTKKIAFLLVDMSLNILQGQFAAVTLFEGSASPDEVRIVSRGLAADRSEAYGKLLLRHYRGQQAGEEREYEQSRPYIRELEWGVTVMECPLFNQSLHGVLSVALDPKDGDGLSFLSSLATIGAIALSRMNQEQDRLGRRIADLHGAISQWDPAAYEFSRNLSEQATRFSEYMGKPASERQELEYAGLISPYAPDIAERLLPDQPKICRIIRDYAFDLHADANRRDADKPPVREEGSQILLLVAESLKGRDKLASSASFAGIDEELRESYRSYLLKNQVVDQQISVKDPEPPRIEGLSNREQEVLHLIVQGFNNKQVAASLFISEHTVKNHITNIFQKLGIGDRAGLIAYFYQQIGN